MSKKHKQADHPSLVAIPREEEQDLIVGNKLFGWGLYEDNLKAMQDPSHREILTRDKESYTSPEAPDLKFRAPLSQESIETLVQGLENYREFPFFPPYSDLEEGAEVRYRGIPYLNATLQIGRIVRFEPDTPGLVDGWNGYFTNTKETNEEKLREILDTAFEEDNGVYLCEDGIAFARTMPYEFFRDMEFPKSRLARALEYTTEKVAKNMSKLISGKHYHKVEEQFCLPCCETTQGVVLFMSNGYAPGQIDIYRTYGNHFEGKSFAVYDSKPSE